MLILITTRCHEGCSHCMHDASPNGYDMSEDTHDAILFFLDSVGPKLIQISGGEPTLHPNFLHFVEKTAKYSPYLIIESNGSFMLDQDRRIQVQHALRISNVHLQVRTHRLYYPNYKRTMRSTKLRKLPKTHVYHDAIRILPIGRATRMKSERKYPACVNTFLVHYQYPALSIAQVAKVLQGNGRFCSPMIDPNGMLHAGESIFCTDLGHVSKPKNLSDTAPCGKCGLCFTN
jgi:hypothetical protein